MRRSIKFRMVLSINIVILLLVLGMALFSYSQSKNIVENLLLSSTENMLSSMPG